MRTIDKSKKSNIKCEHCEYFKSFKDAIDICINKESSKYGTVNYWNRCKCFEWRK